MTFRASNQTTSDAYENVKRISMEVKTLCLDEGQKMQANPTTSADIPLMLVRAFVKSVSALDTQTAVPGLAAYAQGQENDPAYDVAAEYQSMRSSIITAKSQLISMFPKDAQGRLLYQSFDANGNIVSTTFTQAQLAPVVTLLNNVAATIS